MMFTLKREIIRKVYGHEVFLSFDSDDEAVLFADWIENGGREAIITEMRRWREEQELIWKQKIQKLRANQKEKE